ncbi:hypothetical protein BDV11DRAFT_178569 [Aspergillus similis]
MQKSQRPKRPRALQACEVCRIRKNRCDEEQPCTYCLEHQLECKYSHPNHAKRRKPTQLARQTSQPHMESTDRATPLRCIKTPFPAGTSKATADVALDTPEVHPGQSHLNSPPCSLSPSESRGGSQQRLPIATPAEPTPATSTAIVTDTNTKIQEFGILRRFLISDFPSTYREDSAGSQLRT